MQLLTSSKKYSKNGKSLTGFSLIEIIVAIAIISILFSAVYGLFTSVINGIAYYRERTTISALADQYLFIARNLPYLQLGTVSGNPSGNLPDLPNAIEIPFDNSNYQIYYVVNYIDDPADGTILQGTDPAPNDYKQIKLYIKNVTTGSTNSFLTNIVPKSLEDLSSGGALFLKVFDAVGQPIPAATIHITNTLLNPNIDLTRITDSDGNWIEVGLPDSINSYHIEATYSGFSSDQTYPITEQNPNPTKPDATISNGQVTQISFSIDKLSNLTISTQGPTCQPISGIDIQVQGTKLIGTPNVLKFDNNYTSNSIGQVPILDVEWDNYTPFLTGTSYMVYGTSPIQPAVILPDTSQNFGLILGPKTNDSLLVLVKDSAINSPIEGASVELQNVSPAVDTTKITGGSVWSQQDWSGGPGQEDFIDTARYFEDDGNINSNGATSGLELVENGSFYVASGSLTSSTFDTGTDLTSYTTLTWQPTSQDPATSVKFQVATNNDNLTWEYLGPDGASGTFYTIPGTTISSVNSNNRYIRYKVFLSTEDPSKTPVLTSVNFNYISGCFTPGQVIFTGLEASDIYEVIISALGYQTKTISDLHIDGYEFLEVSLEP